MIGSSLEAVKAELRAIEAENDRLRHEMVRERAVLRNVERQFADLASELNAVYASRTWKLAKVLRGMLRRLRAARARTARPVPPAPPQIAAPAVSVLTADQPCVSLLLPGGGALPDAAAAGVAFEVLMPGTASPDDPPGVRRVAIPEGASPAAICNALAEAARGERIAVWDGVAIPSPGWLQALDEALRLFERAGLAGGVLFGPDGRIAVAGYELEPDGVLRPLGRFGSPLDPALASVAPVDAMPLGCVMAPASVWRHAGGLDGEIVSLDHAFADLALRLRDSGHTVLRQPFARLTLEAPAGAADPWAAAHGRWRVRQTAHAGGRGLASLGLRAAPAPRALFYDREVPTPDRDSGSSDIFWVMRIFVALGYEVTLLPAADLDRADRYVDDLRRHGVRVVANGFASTPADFFAREAQPFDVVMLFRGSLAGKAVLDELARHSPQARLVFNAVDLHFLRLEREALLTRSAADLDASFAVKQVELAAITRADCTVVLSMAERRIIADLLPRARVAVIPMARDIPGRKAPFAPRHGVLFVGGFRHQPNVDAITAFVREVWPLVRARLDTTLMIAGADAPEEVRALASLHDDICVLGHVEDLDELLARCRLTVAPLRYGAGIKGKIVSSLAAGVPCVATPIAVEGMGLADRVQVRVAAGPEAFADTVVELHQDEAAWNAVSDGGLQFALGTFSVAETRRRICDMLDELGLPTGCGG